MKSAETHPLMDAELSSYESHRGLVTSMHSWPLNVPFMSEMIDGFIMDTYSFEMHPFYRMLLDVPMKVPKEYNTNPEEAKKLFVDCYRTEVFSRPFLGSYSMTDLFTDEFFSDDMVRPIYV